jgi:quinol monooxygenase YgiN
MWAQLIKAKLKPGQEEHLRTIARDFEARSRAEGLGPTRVIVFQNQKDPAEHYHVAFFESEEQARQFERDPRQADMTRGFSDIYEGPPEYVDLTPFVEFSR